MSSGKRARRRRDAPDRIERGRLTAVLVLVGLTLIAAPSLSFIWPGVDARFALVWGDELVSGAGPDFDGAVPAKHPLTLGFGAVLSIAGPTGARSGLGAISLLSLALLLYSVYRLGCFAGGRPVGALATVLVLTLPEVLQQAASSGKDLQFAALTLAAVALFIARREQGWPWIFGLLALAGLIRPEAWALAALYGAYLWLRRAGPRRAAIVALVMIAPAIWLSMDLVLTGDPLHTVNHTREKPSLKRAEGIVDPERVSDVAAKPRIERFASGLEGGFPGQVGWPLTIAAALISFSAVAARRVARRPRRRGGGLEAPPPEPLLTLLAIVAAGVAFAAALVIFNLPLVDRFLLVPAIATLIIAAAALPRARGDGLAALALGLVVVGTIAALPGRISEVGDSYRASSRNADRADELARLTADPAVTVALRRCPDLVFGGRPRGTVQLGRAVVAPELGIGLDEVPLSPSPLLEGPGDSAFARGFAPDQRKLYDGNRRGATPPTVVENGEWLFASLCRTDRVSSGSR